MTMPNSSDSPRPSPPVFTQFHLILAAVVIGWILLGIYWYTFTTPAAPNPESQPGVGSRLTFLDFRPLTGGPAPISPKSLDGRVTLVNIWGTWCHWCRKELPSLVALRQRYAGQESFRLLAVSYPPRGAREDVASLRENTADLLKSMELDLPTYYDPAGATLARLQPLVEFQGYPTTLLLDRKGVVRAVWSGYWPGAETEMERLIGKVLEEERK